MNINKLLLASILLSFFLLMSCSSDDSNPTEPDNGTPQQNSNPSGQPLPSMAQGGDGILATISYEFQSAPGFPAVGLKMGFAQFGSGVDGGTVSVNSNSLGKTTASGTTFYISPSPSNPTQTLTGISFDGSNHSWQVSGSGDVAQMSGSVVSPTNFSVSSPANNASVNKANGINVAWSNSSASSRILVVLAAIDNSGNYYYADIDDTGSYTIPASDIGGFSGQCMLQVVKYNYNSVSAGGKTYYLVSEIVKSVTVTVN